MPNAPKSKTSLRKLVKNVGTKAALRIARDTNAPAAVQELAEALDKVTALAGGQRDKTATLLSHDGLLQDGICLNHNPRSRSQSTRASYV